MRCARLLVFLMLLVSVWLLQREGVMYISYVTDLVAGISLEPFKGTGQLGTACVTGGERKGSERTGWT